MGVRSYHGARRDPRHGHPALTTLPPAKNGGGVKNDGIANNNRVARSRHWYGTLQAAEERRAGSKERESEDGRRRMS